MHAIHARVCTHAVTHADGPEDVAMATATLQPGADETESSRAESDARMGSACVTPLHHPADLTPSPPRPSPCCSPEPTHATACGYPIAVGDENCLPGGAADAMMATGGNAEAAAGVSCAAGGLDLASLGVNGGAVSGADAGGEVDSDGAAGTWGSSGAVSDNDDDDGDVDSAAAAAAMELQSALGPDTPDVTAEGDEQGETQPGLLAPAVQPFDMWAAAPSSAGVGVCCDTGNVVCV